MLAVIVALLWFLSAYLIAGFVFAAAFVALGVTRVDPAAANTGLPFRLLILPGVAATWPLMAARWVRAMKGAPS